MISHLRGSIDKKNAGSVVIDAGGVGYEVFTPVSTLASLPGTGAEVKLYVVESTTMYGGGTTLYGFLTQEEKEIFTLLREEVPGAGAKKALEYMDKITKSVSDFKHAVVGRDSGLLTSLFGFTRKTADKLIAALKDKTGAIPDSGKRKFRGKAEGNGRSEAIAGLVALGYRENTAREAVDAALASAERELPLEEIIKLALRRL